MFVIVLLRLNYSSKRDECSSLGNAFTFSVVANNFFPFQHLSPATQSAIDQGVSFSVDSINFFVSLL